MPRERFISGDRFHTNTLWLIGQAREICDEYAEQGFVLTLRQLYYQFVARDLIPNEFSEYKRLGEAVKKGRRAGLLDWDSIEDRTRSLRSTPHWESGRDILQTAADQFAIDKWARQERRVEVWIEKDALLGLVERPCKKLDVPYFACRGYASDSALWRAAKRFQEFARDGQESVVIHLGDHDPSGIHMTEDNQSWVDMFSRYSGVEVRRIALNMDQVEEYGPPPNFAKETDSRYAAYAELFGEHCWELDALQPAVIEDLVHDEVSALRTDEDVWDEDVEREKENRDRLQELTDDWRDEPVAEMTEEDIL